MVIDFCGRDIERWRYGLSLIVPFESVMSFLYEVNVKLIKDVEVRCTICVTIIILEESSTKSRRLF